MDIPKSDKDSFGTYAKRKNFSIIAAVTKGQILGFQIFVEGINATAFGAFLINLTTQVPDIQYNPGRYVFLWIMQLFIKRR